MTTPFSLALSGDLLEHITPFHLVWDKDGVLVHCSSKAQSFFELGKDLPSSSDFLFTHPFQAPLEPALFPEITRLILHLAHSNTPTLILRGELLRLDGDEGWLFSGMPPASSVSELKAFGVKLSELPLHLGIGDYLLANQAAQVSLGESKRANDALKVTTEELRAHSMLLEEKSKALTGEIKDHRLAKAHLERALAELKAMQATLVKQERLKALGEMISGITHDFNNILTPIVAYSDMLGDEDISKEEHGEYLSVILTAAQDATELIQRLRRYYKPNMSDLEYSQYSLNRVLADALALAQPRWSSSPFEGKKKIVVVNNHGADPLLFGVVNEIRQALLNVLVNAADAIEKEGTITITTGVEEDMVWISMADTGAGMTPEILQRCGESFFTTKGARGTGLGLSMVYKAASRHGGRVALESLVGEGTRVTVHLSRDPKAYMEAEEGDLEEGRGASIVEDEARLAANGVAIGEERSKGSTSHALNVLVVDDDLTILRLLGKTFINEGHHVMEAADGEAALALTKRHSFELIICDVDMPKLRGDDFAVEARLIQPEVALILFSGDPDNIHQEGREAADHILSKPNEAAFVMFCGQAIVKEKRSV